MIDPKTEAKKKALALTEQHGLASGVGFNDLNGSEQFLVQFLMMLMQLMAPARDGDTGLTKSISEAFGLKSTNEYNTMREDLRAQGRDKVAEGRDYTNLNREKLSSAGQQALRSPAPGTEGALLDLIGKYESRGDYNLAYGNKKANFSDMSVDQVLAWQDRYVASGSASSAAGKYQIIRSTLRGLKAEIGLTGAEKFDEAMQDRMAMALLRRRGLDDFQAGRISSDKFMKNLSQEWASLPKDGSGLSYYDGDGLNKAHAKPHEVLAVLSEAKSGSGIQLAAAQRTGETLDALKDRAPLKAGFPPAVMGEAAPSALQAPKMQTFESAASANNDTYKITVNAPTPQPS